MKKGLATSGCEKRTEGRKVFGVGHSGVEKEKGEVGHSGVEKEKGETSRDKRRRGK